MYTNVQMYRPSVVETVVRERKPYTPWAAAPTIELQRLETKIRRLFSVIKTEVADEPVYHHNPDIPDTRHSIDQGFAHPINDHLEPVFGKSQMDGGHFRELCVQRGPSHARSNNVLHLKSKLQLLPKTWMRAEYIADKAKIPYDLAFQVVEAFKKLSITKWSTARQLLQGVVATGKIWTPRGTLQTGLAGKTLRTGIAKAKDQVKAALYIIELAAGLDKLYDVDEPLAPVTHIDDMYADSMTYGFDVMNGYDEPDTDEMADDDTPDPLEEPPKDDLLDAPGTDNAFSTHALCGDGSDALPYSFEYEIANADERGLKHLVAGMFTSYKEGGSEPTFEFTEGQRAYLRQIGYAEYRYMSQDERMYYMMCDPKRLDYIEQVDRISRTFTDTEIDLAEKYIQDPKSLPPGSRIPRAFISKKSIKIPKRYWFFSPAQQKHFWTLWKARKAEIAKAARADSNFTRLLGFILAANKRDAALAIIAYRDRQSFDLWGVEIILDGSQVPSKDTIAEAWSAYKTKFAA